MTKTALKTFAGAASALFLLGIHTLAAGPEKVRAEAYFNAISGGNPETIASFYADNAEFHWIGGPLAGVYTGKAQIKSVWERFTKAAGDINHKVLELSESQKGKLSTVTARVNFIGPAEVPVRFTMVYENGKIVNEIWEVDKPVIGVARVDVKPETSAHPEEQAKADATADEPATNADQAQEHSKADAALEVGERGKEAAVVVPPAPAKRVDVADAGKDAGTPPLPEHSTAAANEDEPKSSGVKGTPTPLPPSFSNARKKSASKPAVAPKKREAQKDTAKNDGPRKKKSTSEYAQRDDDDDDYDRYSDYESSDYYRHPYYGYYGRPYYGPSFRFRFGNYGYGYRSYNRYGYYGYGRY